MTIAEQYIAHVQQAFDKAEHGEGKLPQEVLEMEGMSGTKTRHFYNNLLELDGAKYLEIGCWKGSSTCAALYGNKAQADIIDDFSGFGGPRVDFKDNFRKFCGGNNAAALHDHDCFKMDLASLLFQPFNIFLWDADHSEDSQRRALDYYVPVMEDVFIYVVDDWNMDTVLSGTLLGIDSNNLRVLWKHEITTPFQDAATWHNGIAVFILQKP